MKRAARLLRTLFLAGSLLLCAGACVLWVRSYADGTELTRVWYERRGSDDHHGGVAVISARGHLLLRYQHAWRAGRPWDAGGPTTSRWLVLRIPQPSDPKRNPPFRWFHFHRVWSQGLRQVDLYIPHWFAALLSLLPVARPLARAVHRRRLRRCGHCPTCGYDLRASPERCPECGREASK